MKIPTRKLLGLCLLLCTAPAVADYEDYFKLLHDYRDALGPVGAATSHEIEIIQDPVEMDKIAKKTGRKVGIVHQDCYWIWINDAVRFPHGATGVYGRMLWVKQLEGKAGAAILPVLSDGRIVLNLNYRHATRSWEWELPRGVVNKGETTKEAALRELKEETGYIADSLIFLGEMAPDTGMTSTLTDVYLAKIKKAGQHCRDDAEAILSIVAFDIQTIKKGLIDGYISIELSGKMTKVPLRDPFLTFALLKTYLFQDVWHWE